MSLPFIRSEDERYQTRILETNLRDIADVVPAWLFDSSGLAGLIDDLDAAISDFDIRHKAQLTGASK